MREKILEIINKESIDDKEFNEFAIEIFEYEYKKNEFYRIFCDKKGKNPKNVKNFYEIPPCPQRAFKYYPLYTENIKPRYIFFSSGTTEGIKSKRYIFYPEIYNEVIYKNFKKFLLPDLEKIKIFVFFPDFEELKNSSLSYMFKKIFEKFGKKGSEYFYKNGKYLFDEFLKKIKKIDEPVALLGTSISFYYLINYLKEKKLKIKLSENSRILDTGGFKGLKITINQKKLYKSYSEFLGIEENFIVNEYGMCELISHYYDVNLKNYFDREKILRYKNGPFWVRWRIVDPESFEEKKEGVLIHYDLANFDSCIGVMTEDKGKKFKDGFILKGRIENSLRGCSILSEYGKTF